MNLQEGDYFFSVDIEKGYRHMRLHPNMRRWLILGNQKYYYQFVDLPFGWRRSQLFFMVFMVPFVQNLPTLGYRVKPYLDDILLAPFQSAWCLLCLNVKLRPP